MTDKEQFAPKMCKRLDTPEISLHVILHVVKQGPVLVHIKK